MKKVLMLFAVAMMLGTTVPTMAQTESFTDQTQFVVAKGNGSINIRKAPNTKAQKVGSISSDETLPVLAEKDGWYQVLLTDGQKGWVSQTVCRISDAALDVTKVSDHVYGTSESYDEYSMWMVAQVKGTDMFVAITGGENVGSPMGKRALWLGKKVGNTLVFDQYVPFTTSMSPDDPNLYEVSPSNYVDDGYQLYYGVKYSMPDNQGGKQFRPSLLKQETIKKLFNGKQKKDCIFFLGPAMFGKKYANAMFG